MKATTLNQIRYKRLAEFAKTHGSKTNDFFIMCEILEAEIYNLETDFELNSLGYFSK